ncbi:glycosyltransferase family 9 protein [Verrucomicrobiaceae bacterium 227]
MPDTQQADSITEPSPLRIEGSHLAIASPTSVSEACFSAPAVRAIRQARPDDTLVILVPNHIAPIWRKVPGIDQIITYQASDSPRKLAKLLKESGQSFDSAIAWDENPAALGFAKAGIPQRLGYPTKKLAKLLTDPVQVIRKTGPIEHQVNHYLLFVQALGINPFHPSNFETPERPAPDGAPQLALVPGSDFGTASEWPLTRFVDFAKALTSQYKLELVILPSPGRPQPALALAKELGKPALVRHLEGDALIDFLATCQGFVGNDGSLPHFASLVGTPSLILFGPNEPEWKRPLGKIHRIVHHREACSGCLLAKCPLDHRCLQEISVDEALKEFNLLFKA